MLIKSQADFYSGVMFTAVGGAFAIGATTYNIGDGARMGPGYFPLMLGILLTLNIEMGVVTPPVGLNLFAVCGTSKIPLPQVVKGTIPFFAADLVVLLLIIFFPDLATWLPDLVVTDAFKK